MKSLVAYPAYGIKLKYYQHGTRVTRVTLKCPSLKQKLISTYLYGMQKLYYLILHTFFILLMKFPKYCKLCSFPKHKLLSNIYYRMRQVLNE